MNPIKAPNPAVEAALKMAAEINNNYSPDDRVNMCANIQSEIVEFAKSEIVSMKNETDHLGDKIKERMNLIEFVNAQKNYGN